SSYGLSRQVWAHGSGKSSGTAPDSQRPPFRNPQSHLTTRRKAAWTPKIETRGRKRKRRRVAALQKRRRFQIVSHVLRDDGGGAGGELLVAVPPVSRRLTAQLAAGPQGRADSISSQAPETHRTAGGRAAGACRFDFFTGSGDSPHSWRQSRRGVPI